MRINRDNYEVFFIDFLQGDLDKERLKELEDFLKENPDLSEEFSLLDPDIAYKESDSQISYDKKESLKKSYIDLTRITANNIDELLIAKHEGDLPLDQIKKVNQWLTTNPEYNGEEEFIKKTFLKADESIVYPAKRRIKRLPGRSIVFRIVSLTGIAASFLLAVWFFDKSPQNTPVKPVAELVDEGKDKAKTSSTQPGRDKQTEDKGKSLSEPGQIKKTSVKQKSGHALEAKNTISYRIAEVQIPSKPSEGMSSAGNVIRAESRELFAMKTSIPVGSLSNPAEPAGGLKMDPGKDKEHYRTSMRVDYLKEQAREEIETTSEKALGWLAGLIFKARETVDENMDIKYEKSEQGTLFALNAAGIEIYRYKSKD